MRQNEMEALLSSSSADDQTTATVQVHRDVARIAKASQRILDTKFRIASFEYRLALMASMAEADATRHETAKESAQEQLAIMEQLFEFKPDDERLAKMITDSKEELGEKDA